MSADVHNSGLRLKAHRRQFMVTDKNGMRRLGAPVLPEQHKAFDEMAAARNITHTALIRQVIEGLIRRPQLLDQVLAGAEIKK